MPYVTTTTVYISADVECSNRKCLKYWEHSPLRLMESASHMEDNAKLFLLATIY